MEIQLVSQFGDEASRFTKFLDEEIIIPPKSQIYLNHTTLSKYKGVNLTEEENLIMVIPDENTFGGGITLLQGTCVIPPDNYTTLELANIMETKFNSIINDNSNLNGYTAYNNVPLYPNSITDSDKKTKVGIVNLPKTQYVNQDVFNNAPINLNNTFTETANITFPEAGVIGANIASTGISSFFMHPSKYFMGNQVYDKDSLIQDEDKNAFSSDCYVFPTFDVGTPLTLQKFWTLQNQTGNPSQYNFGFYSKEYSAESTVGIGNRTDSTAVINVPITKDGTNTGLSAPTAFISCNIRTHATGGVSNVYADLLIARDTENLTEWTTMQREITSMEVIQSVNLTEIYGLNSSVNFQFGIYRDMITSSPDSQEIYRPYFITRTKNLNLTSENLFDKSDIRIPVAFLNGLGYTTDIIKSSQLLNAFLSTNMDLVGGFLGVKTFQSDYNAVSSIIRKWSLKTEKNILEVFGEVNNSTETILPNRFPNTQIFNFYREKVIYSLYDSDVFRTKSYAVRLNNFPIQSYKTNQNKNQKGYKQSILGIIPTPFQTIQDTNLPSELSNDLVQATYVSQYPHIKNLDNQEFIVNRFDIEIVDLTTDYLARDLRQTSLNFTILPGE